MLTAIDNSMLWSVVRWVVANLLDSSRPPMLYLHGRRFLSNVVSEKDHKRGIWRHEDFMFNVYMPYKLNGASHDACLHLISPITRLVTLSHAGIRHENCRSKLAIILIGKCRVFICGRLVCISSTQEPQSLAESYIVSHVLLLPHS